MEISVLNNSASSHEAGGWNERNLPLRWPARIVGVSAAGLFIASRELGSPTLDSVAKSFFCTAVVFLPLIFLNRDLFTERSAWVMTFSLLVTQIGLIAFAWKSLRDWNFIMLTPVCVAQLMLFAAPFFILRRKRGFNYPRENAQP
jgi:hypothetical protein